MATTSGPLAGYRIIDLTSFITGPYATMWLGDQGADVIKIETPGVGDLMRYGGTSRKGLAAFFLTSNRNKRSVTLNLKQPAAVEALRQLVETADVFVQNFRPGVAERLGLSEADLRGRNERLIYVSIAGFGAAGPYASRRVYDTVIQAMSGMAHLQKGKRDVPEVARTVLADKVTAQTVAQAITAALLARERRGLGQRIEISMLDAMVAWLWPDGMTDLTFIGDDGVTRLGSVANAELIFPTQDGFIMVASVSDEEFRALARGLGNPDLAEDERFATMQGRLLNARALADILRVELLQHPTEYWNARFAAEDAVSAPVNTPRDMIHDPQVIASGTLFETDHSVAGRIRQPNHPIHFSATPADAGALEAPALGADTREVLAELGLSNEEIDRVCGAPERTNN